MAVARPRGPGDEHAEQRDPGQQWDEHAGVADTAVALMISTSGLLAAVRDRIVVYASFEPSRQAAGHE